MKLGLYCILLALHLGSSAIAQEINARVQVFSPLVQNTNKNTIKVLTNSIRDFLNTTKWTEKNVRQEERINFTLVLNISQWDGSNKFKAEAQILASRPIYQTDYYSPTLSIKDKQFDFNYTELQPLVFTQGRYDNNLSSLIAFYVYTIIGWDKDSFSELAGTDCFSKAREIVNESQNSGFAGWKATEDFKNRYWIAENLNSNNYIPLRKFNYIYHREGLDMLLNNEKDALNAICSALPDLTKTDRLSQGAMITQIFFASKQDELKDVLSKGDYEQRLKVYNALQTLDPANINKYINLIKN